MDWQRGSWRGPVRRDLRMMLNYNQFMKWYYYYKATIPDYTGSYAEQDLLHATTMGLNHFAHVMGHPAAGELMSVPKYSIESTLWEDPEAIDGAKRMEPTDVMIPWDWLGTCTAYAIADVQNGKPQAAADGYTLSKANLGDGRPFFAGFTDDYEDWYVTYVGAFYPKSYVAAALGDSSTFTRNRIDPRPTVLPRTGTGSFQRSW